MRFFLNAEEETSREVTYFSKQKKEVTPLRDIKQKSEVTPLRDIKVFDLVVLRTTAFIKKNFSFYQLVRFVSCNLFQSQHFKLAF